MCGGIRDLDTTLALCGAMVGGKHPDRQVKLCQALLWRREASVPGLGTWNDNRMRKVVYVQANLMALACATLV